jgi:DNA-binding CsgD family transcriptional regulator
VTPDDEPPWRPIINHRAADFVGLTGRKLEALSYVAAGLDNAQIGFWMGIAGDTVKTHLLRAFRVLQVHDRSLAVAVCYERKIFRLPADSIDDDALATVARELAALHQVLHRAMHHIQAAHAAFTKHEAARKGKRR